MLFKIIHSVYTVATMFAMVALVAPSCSSQHNSAEKRIVSLDKQAEKMKK